MSPPFPAILNNLEVIALNRDKDVRKNPRRRTCGLPGRSAILRRTARNTRPSSSSRSNNDTRLWPDVSAIPDAIKTLGLRRRMIYLR
jgi:hypothetical protein